MTPTPKCRIDQCDRTIVYKKHKLCAAHYQRYRTGLDVNVVIRRSRSMPEFKGGKR